METMVYLAKGGRGGCKASKQARYEKKKGLWKEEGEMTSDS
jgi:hypothetical protein